MGQKVTTTKAKGARGAVKVTKTSNKQSGKKGK